jgi:hypothetical protein
MNNTTEITMNYNFTPYEDSQWGVCKVDKMASNETIDFVNTLTEHEMLKIFPHSVESDSKDKGYGRSFLWRTDQGFIVGIGFRYSEPRLRGNHFKIYSSLNKQERSLLFHKLEEHIKQYMKLI